MKVTAVTHHPLSRGGPRCSLTQVDVVPTDTVRKVKEAVSIATGVDIALLTFCSKGVVREDDQPLTDSDEFEKHPKSGEVFLHLREEDPDVNAKVEELLASQSFIIPLDQVKVKQAA
eukprot:m.363363 g.363363  ORF g.363363 m.363363 type:complete len:117 (+) comp22143_c0_seq1:227-577(+)